MTTMSLAGAYWLGDRLGAQHAVPRDFPVPIRHQVINTTFKHIVSYYHTTL